MPRRVPLGVRNGEVGEDSTREEWKLWHAKTRETMHATLLCQIGERNQEQLGVERIQVERGQEQIQDTVSELSEESRRQPEFETRTQDQEHVFVPFTPSKLRNGTIENPNAGKEEQVEENAAENVGEGAQTDHPSLLHRLLVRQIHALHTENDQLKSGKKPFSSDVRTMHAEVEAGSTKASDRLEVAKTRLQKKNQEVEEKAKEIRGLESTIAQLNAVLSRKDQDLIRYQTLLQENEGRLLEVQTSGDRCKKKLEDQIVIALRKVADTRSSMVEVKEELTQSKRKVSILEASKKAEVEELTAEVQKLKSQKGELQALLVRKTAEHEKLEAEIRTIGEELKQTQKIVERSRAADAESQMEFEDLFGQVRILECEVKDLVANQNEQKALAESALQEKTKVLHALRLLQKQFEQLKLDQAQERIGSARESSRVAELEQSNVALTAQCQHAEQSTCKLQEEVQEFKQAKAELEAVNEFLRARLERLERQPNAMYRELQAMMKEAEQKAEELETLLQEERDKTLQIEPAVEPASPPRQRRITWKRVVILPLAYAFMTLSRTIAHQRRRKNIFELERKKLLSRKYNFSN